MPEPGEIVMHKAGEDFHVCPACGYALGFHTSFLSASAARDNPIKSTREVYRVILICPECGVRYDVGWRISFSEFESKFVRAPVKPATASPRAVPEPSSENTGARLLPAADTHNEHSHE